MSELRSSREVMRDRVSLRTEMAASDLGDARLNARRDRVIAALERHPDTGFPEACGTDAETEALYRFVRNRRVSLEAVIAPHIHATAERCRAVRNVLVIHDTTQNVFTGERPRAGLTPLGPRRQGFWLHAALAVSCDGGRAPLGVLGLAPFLRRTDPTRVKKPHWRERFRDPAKESRRWVKGVAVVRERLGPDAAPIHVMDREGDNYELFADLMAHHDRFVVRLNYDRKLVRGALHDPETVDAARPSVVLTEQTVIVAARQVGTRPRPLVARRPARDARTATVSITAATVSLKRPRDHRAPVPAALTVNVVYAVETDPPAGESPIEWRLVTTEPIASRNDVLQILEWYRTRWLIEEFFKCLKTGCAYERRQLESLPTLLVALGLLAPIAWQLLLMRHLSRERPETPATLVLTPRQIALLRQTPGGRTLSRTASIRDVLLAVGRLGGHLRQNGEPGWLILNRGMQTLLTMEAGWIAASTCDQS